MDGTLLGKRNFTNVVNMRFLKGLIFLELSGLFWILIILSWWVQCNSKGAEKTDAEELGSGKEESEWKQSLE